jgi:signal transduction histidine kinase
MVPDTIPTDEVALTGILRNLLSNGIKYTGHGEVRLGARVREPRLEISVADTGIGIPAGLLRAERTGGSLLRPMATWR